MWREIYVSNHTCVMRIEQYKRPMNGPENVHAEACDLLPTGNDPSCAHLWRYLNKQINGLLNDFDVLVISGIICIILKCC